MKVVHDEVREPSLSDAGAGATNDTACVSFPGRTIETRTLALLMLCAIPLPVLTGLRDPACESDTPTAPRTLLPAPPHPP
jgi:hypothetical protein